MEMEGSEESGSLNIEEEIQISEDEMGCDLEKIYYTDGVYSHVSGMMFDPDEKRYFTWVSNDDEDLRELYYLPNKDGEFNLAVRGEMGRNNREILNANDWDKSVISSDATLGYRADLLLLFRRKFKEMNEKRKMRFES